VVANDNWRKDQCRNLRFEFRHTCNITSVNLETLFFDREQDAIEILTKSFTQQKNAYKLKQIKDRKVFVNTVQGNQKYLTIKRGL
jgi:hypothetical protein